MPTIEFNKAEWEHRYTWHQAGDEWSRNYGSAALQWHASLMPRIHAFIPAPTILEIAPGFGRWTQFLKDQCQRLILVDLTEKCIEACKQRFSSATNIEYHVNDGSSLKMVPDNSIDFLFTYDSLVHAGKEVLQSYVQQTASKLTKNGVAFIHHSNCGAYDSYFKWIDWLKPERLPRGRRFLMRTGILETSDSMRDRGMTAELFRQMAQDAGLRVIGQELHNWNSYRLIDCISLVTKPGSRFDREYRLLINRSFERQSHEIGRLAPVYAGSSFAKSFRQ